MLLYFLKNINYMTILSILKIQTKIFINNLAKINSVLKIIYVFAFVFILFNYSQTGKFFLDYVKNHFNSNDAHFYAIANLLLFVIFLLNLFSVFFFGIGSTLSKQLKFFPISLFKIVSYEILTGIFDITNLMFVGLYISMYFIFAETLLLLSFFKFFIIFFLFVLLVSNISFFAKNVISNYFALHRKKKVIQIISIILFIVCFQYLQTLKINNFNLAKFSDILNYFPTGMFLLFSFKAHPSSLFFFGTLTYFLLFNLMFLLVNASLTKKLLRINYTKATKLNNFKTKYSVSYYIKKSKFNTLQKKEILYHLRSYKMSINFSFLFLCYTIILYSFLFNKDFGDTKDLLTSSQNMGLFFHLIIIVTLTGNIFRFGGLDLKSYFLFPISTIDLINSKVIITYFWLVVNFIVVTIGLFQSGITLFNYLYFVALLLITFHLFHFIAILLSIYFPKKLNMDAINGLNLSFVTLLIFVPILAICFLLLQYVLSFQALLPKIIIILLSVILTLLSSKLPIINYLSSLLDRRKSLIIEKLS